VFLGSIIEGKVKKLQGIVMVINKTDDYKEDEEGNKWYKCIFVVKLVGFSKRTLDEEFPNELKEARVKVVR